MNDSEILLHEEISELEISIQQLERSNIELLEFAADEELYAVVMENRNVIERKKAELEKKKKATSSSCVRIAGKEKPKKKEEAGGIFL
jgi:hypothetical protein